jgi:hypothetical protein
MSCEQQWFDAPLQEFLVCTMVICKPRLRRGLRADAAMRSIEISAVRELPDKPTIEHDVTQTNTTPSQVHASGSRCWLCVFMIGRRNGRAGEADPQRDRDWKDPCPDSAGVPGSSFPAGGSVRETRATAGQVARAGDFAHPRIRGDSGQPSRID